MVETVTSRRYDPALNRALDRLVERRQHQPARSLTVSANLQRTQNSTGPEAQMSNALRALEEDASASHSRGSDQ